MRSRWGSLLSPGSRIAAVFEGELRQHLAAEYEEDDELVKHVIDQLKEVETQQRLHAEFVEVFDDGAEDMASWCWNKMQQLSTEPQEEAIDSAPEELLLDDPDEDLALEEEGEEGELAEDDELGSGGAEAQLAAEQQQQQQPGKKPKREPIKFDLKSPAADTAPHKSSRKFQSQPEKPAVQHKPDNRAARPAAAAAAAEAPVSQPLHRSDTAKSRAESRGKPTARQEEAPRRAAAAAVKGALDEAVKSAAAPSRPARVSDSVSSKEQPVAAADRLTQSPGAGESRSQDRNRERPQQDGHRNRTDRDAAAAATVAGATGRLAGGKRSAADAVGRGLFGRAFQQLAGAAERSTRAERTDKAARGRQQQQQQQQQETERQREPRHPSPQQPPEQEQSRAGHQGRLSVLQRLGAKEQQEHGGEANKHKNVFERLCIPAGDKPSAVPSAAADNVPNKQQQLTKTLQQPVPQQDSGSARVAASGGHSKAQRLTVYERLGGGAAAAGTDSAKQQQHQHKQQQEQQPAKQAAAPVTPTPAQPVAAAAPMAVGVKRKAEASNGNAAPKTLAAAAPAAKKPAAAAAAAAAAAPTVGSGSAKPGKTATKAAQLAQMRAMIEAKAAEVKRLQQSKQQAEQQAEADKRSVAVFGVPHAVPESVLRAHFAVCGTIKRLTMLPGRPPHLPGAYVEYDTTKAALQALGLTGTMLLPNCPMLTVQIKYDFDQNRIRGQKSFAALQKTVTAGAAAGNRNCVNTTPVVVSSSTAATAAGEPESPASLGDMGLM